MDRDDDDRADKAHGPRRIGRGFTAAEIAAYKLSVEETRPQREKRRAQWEREHPPREYFGDQALKRLDEALAVETNKRERRRVRRLREWVLCSPERAAPLPASRAMPRTARRARARRHRAAVRAASRDGDSGDSDPSPDPAPTVLLGGAP